MKIKSEMWDKMQYLFRDYYDRMVHAVLHFDGPIQPEILTDVLLYTTELVPILRSKFVSNVVDPYWETQEYSISDILTVKDSDNPDKETHEFLTQIIPIENNVQYKVLLLNPTKKASLAVLVNHMCFDGGDFKYFLSRLAANYNNIIDGKKLHIKTGSRSYDFIYENLTEEDKKTAKNLYKNASSVKDKQYFPLTPDDATDRSMICKRKIPRDVFLNLKNSGKKLKTTINDLILAAFIHSLYELGNYPENSSVTVQCMVDLRRHLTPELVNKTGLTNHTGFMQCFVPNKGKTINDTLLNVMKSNNATKKNKLLGLSGLPLLNLAYTILPNLGAETAIKIGYLNPLIGLSNIGVLKQDTLMFKDSKPIDGFMTGAVKYKPYMQLAVTTLDNQMTMTVAIRGNKDDKVIIEKFFDLMEKNIQDFIKTNK